MILIMTLCLCIVTLQQFLLQSQFTQPTPELLYTKKILQISEEAERYLKTAYLKLRLNNDYHSTRITVRQLESLIRLSEAYARLKCASQVFIIELNINA